MVKSLGKAIGMIETKGLIGSIKAADAMLKSADVRLVTQEKIDAGFVTVIIEGDVGAVQAAIESGEIAATNVGELIASHVIPNLDESMSKIILSKSVVIEEKISKINAKVVSVQKNNSKNIQVEDEPKNKKTKK